MPTVYVVSETAQHNISSALSFGEIKPLLPPMAQVAFSPAPTVHRILRGLEKFSDNDYLLCIGDPTAIGIACAAAAACNDGRFKCLKWDKHEKRYIPVAIDLFQKGEFDVEE